MENIWKLIQGPTTKFVGTDDEYEDCAWDSVA